MDLSQPFSAPAWDALPWDEGVSSGFWIPESHYWKTSIDGLSSEQRLELNRLSVCFSCELFIVFEEYLVRYLRRFHHNLPCFHDFDFKQFLKEEVIHQKAFARLLQNLDPDNYPNGDCRFFKWDWRDEWVVSKTPRATMFLMATLFEQITIGMVPALEDHPQQSCPLVDAVMRTHALEEKRHVAFDTLVLRKIRDESLKINLIWQSILTLPLLAYVDHRVTQSWRRAATLFCRAQNLTPDQAKKIHRRPMSASDYLGFCAFLRFLKKYPLPGSRPLRALIRRQIFKYEQLC